jgi:hypothetical protein
MDTVDEACRETELQQGKSTTGSQKSGPTVGGRGSRAPRELLRGGPPGIPGKPRPAPRKFGAKRLVVAGVIILAEIPLPAGAPADGAGEITTGGCGIGELTTGGC